MPTRPRSRPPRRQRGATLVEFVIIFPLAAMFVLGLIQFGLLYMARMQLNHATFMAARAGSMANADPAVMKHALLKSLNVFYEHADTPSDLNRIVEAGGFAKAAEFDPTTTLDLVNPSPAAFKDFGVQDPDTHVTYIPNDNLEFRSMSNGGSSKMNLRDANVLKIRVVYGVLLVVPVIDRVVRRLMCGGTVGVQGWGGTVTLLDAEFSPASKQCLLYYNRPTDPGHVYIPIESTAIVDMQSRAIQKK